MRKLRYIDVKSKEREFLSLTSLTIEEFEMLIPEFEKAFQERMSKWRIDGKPREKRRYTTYKNSTLPSAEDRLLFILSYMKGNPLQSHHGLLFGMSQGKTSNWIHALLPALRTTLRNLGLAPARSVTELAERLNVSVPGADASALVEEVPPSLFCHDGTERRIERPYDAAEQKAYYSGKKRTHTIKNLLLIDLTLMILLLTDTYPGRVHDKRIADAYPYLLPDGSCLLQDLGFLAFALEDVTCLTPFKKPKGGELTPEQKEFNRQLATIRIRIEHVNSSVKRCRIVKDICRLRVVGAQDAVMEIACSLHNFRISLFPWQPLI